MATVIAVASLRFRAGIPNRSAEELAAGIPRAAKLDLLEWAGSNDAAPYLQKVISQEISINSTLNPDPRIRITDDQPYNEYFLLRRWKLLGPPLPSTAPAVRTATR